ncbi:hypothetical protein BT93_H1887 [Corymbia citriodora subsp. variegata]|nr:hypothetical protein BT93_H1887 [Corymbia citriodora subsp. variegata]
MFVRKSCKWIQFFVETVVTLGMCCAHQGSSNSSATSYITCTSVVPEI